MLIVQKNSLAWTTKHCFEYEQALHEIESGLQGLDIAAILMVASLILACCITHVAHSPVVCFFFIPQQGTGMASFMQKAFSNNTL